MRLGTHKWVVASKDPDLKEYSEVVSRNIHRARVRLSSQKPRRRLGPEELPRDAEGNGVPEPSDDHMLLPVSEKMLLTQTPLPVLGPTCSAFRNPTAKRSDPQSVPPAERDPKVSRMEGASCAKGDLAFTQRYAMSPPASQLITVSPVQLKRAGDEPTRGWQTYPALYPDSNPAEVAHDPVCVSKNFRNIGVSHGCEPGDSMGPLNTALEAAKAGRIDPGISVP